MKTIEERARVLGLTYARQYHHNSDYLAGNNDFVYSNEEIADACIEMAKDQQEIDLKTVCEVLKKLSTDYYCIEGIEYVKIPILNLDNFIHIVKDWKL